jgi:hypothetical protein
MKSFFRAMRAVAFILAASSFADAASPIQIPVPTSAGVTISLSTSGYRFNNSWPIISGSGPNIYASTAAQNLLMIFPGFNASVGLVNYTGSDIDFTFPTAANAAQHFVFRMLDANENVVWQSNAETVSAQVITHAILAAHSAWRQQLFVPLLVNGERLAPGQYVLEARIAGSPEFTATSTFEITQTSTSELRSGIRGTVVRGPLIGVQVQGQLNEAPVPNATVKISGPVIVPTPGAPGTATPMFISIGQTHTLTADSQGKFEIALPSGKYYATASLPLIAQPLNLKGDGKAKAKSSQTGAALISNSSAPTMVIVAAEQYSDVTLHIDTGIRPPITANGARP